MVFMFTLMLERIARAVLLLFIELRKAIKIQNNAFNIFL